MQINGSEYQQKTWYIPAHDEFTEITFLLYSESISRDSQELMFPTVQRQTWSSGSVQSPPVWIISHYCPWQQRKGLRGYLVFLITSLNSLDFVASQSLLNTKHKTSAQNPSFGLNLVLLLNKYIVFLVSCEYIIPFLDNEYIFLEAGNENEVYATK